MGKKYEHTGMRLELHFICAVNTQIFSMVIGVGCVAALISTMFLNPVYFIYRPVLEPIIY